MTFLRFFFFFFFFFLFIFAEKIKLHTSCEVSAWHNNCRQYSVFFFVFFFLKIKLDISCELSTMLRERKTTCVSFRLFSSGVCYNSEWV